MPVHLHREIDRLKKQCLGLAAIVEEALANSIKAVEMRDAKLAQSVIDHDDDIDLREIDVEEECLKILALYQPVAADLRYIVSVLKLNSDLERIGDLAVNIAERAIALAKTPNMELPQIVKDMAAKVQSMVRRALEALVNMNSVTAQGVCESDAEVDQLHRSMYGYIEEKILKAPELIDQQLQTLAVSRYLERIADHATNIAEDVLYMVQGAIMRHQSAQRRRVKTVRHNPDHSHR